MKSGTRAPEMAAVVALFLLAGCLHTTGPILDEDFGDGNISEWDTETYGNNEGEVFVREGKLVLRVRRCHNAEARYELGDRSGPVTVTFDWRTEAQEWYEIPGWRVSTGVGNASYTVVNGSDIGSPGRANTSEGSVEADVLLDGESTLVYEIHPSEYCSNLDHGNTTLVVDNVTVESAG